MPKATILQDHLDRKYEWKGEQEGLMTSKIELETRAYVYTVKCECSSVEQEMYNQSKLTPEHMELTGFINGDGNTKLQPTSNTTPALHNWHPLL